MKTSFDYLMSEKGEIVKQRADGRWFITMGNAGFNSPANNRDGYSSEESALQAHRRYASKGSKTSR